MSGGKNNSMKESVSGKESFSGSLLKIAVWAAAIAFIPLLLYVVIVAPDLNAAAIIVAGSAWYLLVPSFAISVGTLLYFLMQAFLAYFYKDVLPGKDEELPLLTVIVPAYNEGKYVVTSLESILACDYPAEKLEVIAVNDGSEDDTWEWISRTAEESGNRIRTVNLKENKGKKHALCTGIRMAKGEIIVTVDSDSRLDKNALRNITARFVNPKVGAVAGYFLVGNKNEGIIPKMLEVMFAFGFEFIRPGQSLIHAVLCTPGAMSAYRLSALLPLLESWENQTFLGKPANIGEDRAITSLLIRNNWYVEFQRDALVYTRMPVTYKGVCKMLIRWCRSDVRENLLMSQYAFSTLALTDIRMHVLRFNLLFANGTLFFTFFWLPLLVWMLFVSPVMTLIYTVSGSVMWSMMPAAIYAFRYNAKDALWAFVYGIYSVPFISWICIYSILTMGNTDWMTRRVTASSGDRDNTENCFEASGTVPPSTEK